MITLAHGGGGRAANELIRREILGRFGGGALDSLPDGATLQNGLVFSADSFVVTPRFFPGGDIGKLAVCGTVNDISVAGGIPQYLSLSLILEEGFAREELGRILDSVKATAAEAGVEIVTGDTKVVPRGAADGIYLNTSGIGRKREGLNLGRNRFQPGDRLLVSGTIGEHGMAILAARHGLGGTLKSDCAIIAPMVAAAAEAAAEGIKFMRDPTRGGVGGVAWEIVEDSACGLELDESTLPLSPGVKTVAGMTGIDPLFSACEGRVLVLASAGAAPPILAAWQKIDRTASCIGVLNSDAGKVTLRGELGFARLLIRPEGDQLPRIC